MRKQERIELTKSLPLKGEVGGGLTLYLGGDTPSQLSAENLQKLFYNINKVYGEASEITIECNPDDLTDEYVAVLAQLPVNRVSMGAQTFSDERLRFLHRRHTAEQVRTAVQRLRTIGIRNISIDLMYGFPQESLADWERDIDAALALGVEHLSAYCLMYEEGTPLYRLLQQGSIHEVDEETERQMYELLMDKLQAAGYEHYEISNWSLTPRTQPSERGLKSYRSQHNSSYWRDVPYIGLGAAAHSYDGQRRSWNVADVNEYIRRVENGLSPIEDSERIEGWTRYNDRITVALRTCEGLDLTTLTDEERDYCMKNARRFLDDGLLKRSDHHITLTRSGLFVSDMVMSELMKV